MSTHYDLIRTALADAVFARIPWNAQNADAVLDERAKKLESDLIALAVQPAPVSATEPDAVRMLREGMRGQHALFNVNQEYVCAVAPLLEYIDALTARLAEAERVTFTDEQIDAGIIAVEALRFMRKVWEPEEKRDAFITAARGGG